MPGVTQDAGAGREVEFARGHANSRAGEPGVDPRLSGSKPQFLATLSLSLLFCEMGLTIRTSLGSGELNEIAR